jgi:hypothetical protein
MGEGRRYAGRRRGISRRGLRALAVIVGYVCALFALGIAFVSPWREILAGTALTVAFGLFIAGALGALGAYMMSKASDWNPPLAAALTMIPLPSALMSLWLWTLGR